METVRTRTATMLYAKDLPIFRHEKPYSILTSFEGCDKPTNMQFGPEQPETITNIRGIEEQFTLDKHGFKYMSSPTAFSDWGNRRAVEENYLPEVEALLLNSVQDVDEVLIFDWRVGSVHQLLRFLKGFPLLELTFHDRDEPRSIVPAKNPLT